MFMLKRGFVRSINFIVVSFFILAIATPALPVSEAALVFLLVSPSPQANAMGNTYGTLGNSSPMSAIFNPANLGLYAQNNFVGEEYYTDKTDWMPNSNWGSPMTLDSEATSFGLNLNDVFNIPISLGIAKHRVKLSMGMYEILAEDGFRTVMFETKEEVKGTTFSLAFDYFVRASVGYTKKQIESVLTHYVDRAEIDAHDFGLLIDFPLYKTLQRFNLVSQSNRNKVEPYIIPGFYASWTNIGDTIVYVKGATPDPIPRNLSIGLNLKTGLKYNGRYSKFNLVSFKWAREVDDILIKVNEDKAREYVSGLHDIKFWDNVILANNNDKIIVKRGYEINLGDIYFVRQGSYQDVEGVVMYSTSGYGINYIQPICLLAELLNVKNPFVKYLSKIHFEKHYAKYNTYSQHPIDGTEFESYVLRLENFPLDEIF